MWRPGRVIRGSDKSCPIHCGGAISAAISATQIDDFINNGANGIVL